MNKTNLPPGDYFITGEALSSASPSRVVRLANWVSNPLENEGTDFRYTSLPGKHGRCSTSVPNKRQGCKSLIKLMVPNYPRYSTNFIFPETYCRVGKTHILCTHVS